VIGHDLWSSRFGRDTAMLGRSIRIGGTVHTVVGVMPMACFLARMLWLLLRAASSQAPARGCACRSWAD
jgi:hypothetical protein